MKGWGARVVYSDGLENRYTRKGIVSSNLTPTAETNSPGEVIDFPLCACSSADRVQDSGSWGRRFESSQAYLFL